MANGMEYMCVSNSEGVVCGSHVGTYSAHESMSLHMCPPLLAPSLRSHPDLHQLSSSKESGRRLDRRLGSDSK